MNLLSDDTMWDLVYDVIVQHKKGSLIVSNLIKGTTSYIADNIEDGCTTEDICDSVLGCFDYYNDFIKEKQIDLPLIPQNEYDMTVMMLNAAINIVQEELDGN